jgi:hypothetical protein
LPGEAHRRNHDSNDGERSEPDDHALLCFLMTTAPERSDVSGWLLLLTRWLIVGQPILFGFTASSAIGAVAIRGLPLALLLVARLVVTALGLAAGLSLSGGRSAAVTMATIALSTSAAADVFTLTTSIWPNNRAPGDTPLYVAATLTFHAAWVIYLHRSKRVRARFLQ